MDGGDSDEPENIWSIDRGTLTSKLSCCHQEFVPKTLRSSNAIKKKKRFKNHNLKPLFIMTNLLIFKKSVYGTFVYNLYLHSKCTIYPLDIIIIYVA